MDIEQKNYIRTSAVLNELCFSRCPKKRQSICLPEERCELFYTCLNCTILAVDMTATYIKGEINNLFKINTCINGK